MLATDKQIIDLPVYTTAEDFLGYVVGFQIDIDHHSVAKYLVSKHKLVNELLRTLVGTELLEITPSQVVSITSERMMVKDTIVRQQAKQRTAFQPVFSSSSLASQQLSQNTLGYVD